MADHRRWAFCAGAPPRRETASPSSRTERFTCPRGAARPPGAGCGGRRCSTTSSCGWWTCRRAGRGGLPSSRWRSRTPPSPTPPALRPLSGSSSGHASLWPRRKSEGPEARGDVSILTWRGDRRCLPRFVRRGPYWFTYYFQGYKDGKKSLAEI